MLSALLGNIGALSSIEHWMCLMKKNLIHGAPTSQPEAAGHV